jgi:hypothetical protein
MTTVLLSQIFIPLSSIKLGRFVTSVDHPHQDYHDPAYNPAPTASIIARAQYDGLGNEARTSGFSTALTSLLSSGFSKSAKSTIRIVTDRIQTYLLPNSSQWFKEATAAAETRQWIERAIDQGDDIFYVIGFHTITDARVTQKVASGKDRTSQISLPVALSLNAAGVIAPLGDLLDPSVSVQYGKANEVAEQFVAPGEQICAFQYRKICHRWLSSKSIDKATLSKVPQWASGDRWRDEGEDDGVEDVIEVDMMEFRMPEDGEWEQEIVDDEMLIVRTFSTF